MMSSTWRPLPDKENTASTFMPASKVRASGPIKISNRGTIPKKQVFGDLKNTIQNFEAEGDECGSIKHSKSGGPVLSCDGKLRDEDWPEPESVSGNLSFEDDYEDCLLPGLKFSEVELESLPDIFGKINKPLASHIEPDSPIPLPLGKIHLDIRPEYSDEGFYEIQPVWDYDI